MIASGEWNCSWGPRPGRSPPPPLTCVNDLLDNIGHLALEQGVEHLHKEDETRAQNHQGSRQQNEPHGQVGQPRIREDMVA